jgi:uncharacterized protein YggE
MQKSSSATGEGRPSLILVQEQQSHEVAADRADLSVTVEGASLFTGSEALKKAREVAQLVSELTASGLPSDAIFLQGISADVQSGTLSKMSRAKYRLRVHCADLSKLADYVGVIALQKNAALNGIEWGYPDNEARHDAWLIACIARVNAKSAQIAAALGVQTTGVHTFSESLQDTEAQQQRVPTLGAEPAGMRRRMTGEDLGLEVSHTKTVYITVTVEFLVSEFA